MDHAKYAANTLCLPLVLLPSILSVDAAFTVAAGKVTSMMSADRSFASVTGTPATVSRSAGV